MKLIDCLLTPCDLYPVKTLEKKAFIILGTCVAEHLVNSALSKGLNVAH